MVAKGLKLHLYPRTLVGYQAVLLFLSLFIVFVYQAKENSLINHPLWFFDGGSSISLPISPEPCPRQGITRTWILLWHRKNTMMCSNGGSCLHGARL